MSSHIRKDSQKIDTSYRSATWELGVPHTHPVDLFENGSIALGPLPFRLPPIGLHPTGLPPFGLKSFRLMG